MTALPGRPNAGLPWPQLDPGRNKVVVPEPDGCDAPVVEVRDRRPRPGRDRAAGGSPGEDQQPPQL
ncbi:hypothetical protein PV341_08485 [Streptomyces sp. PA03-1a]|nr:hypothetical protein [Streptomyces sp. PA03-1a]MDX2814368.1 hypothetical protein [Streptomyces sp. PA03-5A]